MGKILVVDDEKELNQAIQDQLKFSGYETDMAFDGREAVEKARKEHFDLILMDLMMPGMDGLEAIRKIREILKDSFVPIIILTGTAESQGIEKGLVESGADEYITKPFNRLSLMARVRSMLRLKAEFDDVRELKELLEDIFTQMGTECLGNMEGPMSSVENALKRMLDAPEKFDSVNLGLALGAREETRKMIDIMDNFRRIYRKRYVKMEEF
ncbi:MAG: response regulator [Nitrospinae bacterium]|nr:response regulator [Nitrospinota bacterium]